MYASGPMGGCAQPITRSSKETKLDNEEGGKKIGVELVGCMSDLSLIVRG